MFFYLITQLMILVNSPTCLVSGAEDSTDPGVFCTTRVTKTLQTLYLLDNLQQLVLTPQNMTSWWSKG